MPFAIATRRRLAAMVTALLLLGLAVPAAIADDADAPEEAGDAGDTGVEDAPVAGVGTAVTDLEVATIGALGDLIDDIDLGTLLAYASTDADAERNELGAGSPFALAAVVAAGEELVASSDGDGTAGGETIALPGGIGSLTVGELEAAVDEAGARSLIDALSGSVDAGLGPLGVALPEGGALAEVDTDTARAVNGAALEGVALDLGDLLPEELLAQLPIDVLLDLIGELPLDLGDELQELIERVRELLGDVLAELEDLDALADEIDALIDDAAGDLDDELDDLLDELDDLLDDLDAAEDDLDAVEETVADLRDELDDLLGDAADVDEVQQLCEATPALPVCDSLDDLIAVQAELDEAIEERDDLRDVVDELRADIDDLRADIDELREEIRDALDAVLDDIRDLVDDLLEGLVELIDLIDGLDVEELLAAVEDLIDGLVGLELLAIEDVAVGVRAASDAEGSDATALCAVEGVRLLGVAAPDVADCDDLGEALGTVRTTLLDVLDELPVIGGVTGGVVTMGGLALTEETGVDDDGYQAAHAAVTPLTLAVDSLRVDLDATGVIEDLLADLDALIGDLLDLDDLLAGVPLPEGGVAIAQQDSLDDLGDLLGGLELVAGDLEMLLPDGEGEFATPELDVAALGVAAQSDFDPGDDPGTGTPVAGDDPGTVGGSPTPTSALPRTGGGLGLALLLLGAGGAVGALRRRELT